MESEYIQRITVNEFNSLFGEMEKELGMEVKPIELSPYENNIGCSVEEFNKFFGIK